MMFHYIILSDRTLEQLAIAFFLEDHVYEISSYSLILSSNITSIWRPALRLLSASHRDFMTLAFLRRLFVQIELHKQN